MWVLAQQILLVHLTPRTAGSLTGTDALGKSFQFKSSWVTVSGGCCYLIACELGQGRQRASCGGIGRTPRGSLEYDRKLDKLLLRTICPLPNTLLSQNQLSPLAARKAQG